MRTIVQIELWNYGIYVIQLWFSIIQIWAPFELLYATTLIQIDELHSSTFWGMSEFSEILLDVNC